MKPISEFNPKTIGQIEYDAFLENHPVNPPWESLGKNIQMQWQYTAERKLRMTPEEKEVELNYKPPTEEEKIRDQYISGWIEGASSGAKPSPREQLKAWADGVNDGYEAREAAVKKAGGYCE